MNFLLNKYTLYIGAGLLIIVGYVILLWNWQNEIKKAAVLEFNNRQLQIQIQENKKYADNMKHLNENQKEIIDKLIADNKKIDEKFSNLQKYLESEQAKRNDRESSDILKNVIEGIITGVVR